MKIKKYDYLVIGAGPFGATFSYEMNKQGYKCLVIDKRKHVAGNIYTENIEGINVHKYGAHIFHTNDKFIWDYLNQFCEFNNYINSPVALNEGNLYNLPFNMNTFYQMWGCTTPDQAKKIILEQSSHIKSINNLEDQAISLVGVDIYEKLIKGYTEKQWGMKCEELPSFIIKRLPLRFVYDNNYFKDRYQGIPIGGYTQIIEKMLEGIDVKLNCDFFEDKEYLESLADKVLYTGPIDQYFDFKHGKLDYRSIEFKNEIIESDNHQGNAVVNYTNSNVPYTRIIEHKHFEFGKQKKTIISKEYSKDFREGDEPFYPINDSKNNLIYNKYKADSNLIIDKVLFGGRLATYKYYDMHQVFASSLNLVKKELSEKNL
ncbi:UDP-galactopyranose mutase [Polaribacter sp.]|nr:UDP-galactopyranose mutase [Polaribacter sp.]